MEEEEELHPFSQSARWYTPGSLGSWLNTSVLSVVMSKQSGNTLIDHHEIIWAKKMSIEVDTSRCLLLLKEKF